MSIFDFNGDGKTSLTEGIIGTSIVSNAINALNRDKEADKGTQPDTKSNTPKTVSDKEWKNVMGWCVRIVIGTAALPVLLWLLSVASRIFDTLN